MTPGVVIMFSTTSSVRRADGPVGLSATNGVGHRTRVPAFMPIEHLILARITGIDS